MVLSPCLQGNNGSSHSSSRAQPQTEPFQRDSRGACPILPIGTAVEVGQKPLGKSQEISPASPKRTSVSEIPVGAVHRDADTQVTDHRDF